MVPDTSDPLFWVDRFSQRLMRRQDKYSRNNDYVIGNHPIPNGDPRYERVLKGLQEKARTNYVGLAIDAVTERMHVKGFRFGNPRELDQDSRRIWDYNNMSLQSVQAIKDAAALSDTYALVSPPREEGGEPVITIEDPRTCIVEPDPVNPLLSIAGMKFYDDYILEHLVAILYLPDRVYVYHGPTAKDFLARDTTRDRALALSGPGGWKLIRSEPNTLGMVPLVRGSWRPEFGVMGMAECEDGAYDIQDRINETVLMRMVIAKSQAFRQRWLTGGHVPTSKGGKGAPKEPRLNPDLDKVWAVTDPNAKFGDFEQADIRQLLEAVRDDVGDFAALTQTPVMYLTNKMVNVSADTMTAAQIGLISKIRSRQQALGWFFETVMKLCFAYKNDPRATEVEATVVWEDPEARSMAEISDMVSKLTSAGIPLPITLEWAGFSEDQVKFAMEEAEKAKEEEAQLMQQQLAAQKQASSDSTTKPKPSSSR